MRIYKFKPYCLSHVIIAMLSLGLMVVACQDNRREKETRTGATSLTTNQPRHEKQAGGNAANPDQICDSTSTKLLTGDQIYVDISGVTIANGQLNISSIIEDKFKIKQGMTFDLLCENGYLARACASEELSEQQSWRLEIVPGSIRPNIQELDKGEVIWAFAVYPARTERSAIRITGKPNLPSIFASLPAKTQRWNSLALKTLGYKQGVDDFTDLDGDGVIDLIEVDGPCDGTAHDDLSCSKIFRLINKQWKQIAFITPA